MDGMTVAPYESNDDVPTLRELARTLADFRDEFRVQMTQVVRKDVHTVEHESLGAKCQVMSDRIARLEAMRLDDDKMKVSNRNQVYLSILGAGLSLVVAIVVAVVK